MAQIKISLDDEMIEFIANYQEHGFSSKSAIIQAALTEYKRKLLERRLLKSAELYQEIYEDDSELQELTDSAAGLCLE